VITFLHCVKCFYILVNFRKYPFIISFCKSFYVQILCSINLLYLHCPLSLHFLANSTYVSVQHHSSRIWRCYQCIVLCTSVKLAATEEFDHNIDLRVSPVLRASSLCRPHRSLLIVIVAYLIRVTSCFASVSPYGQTLKSSTIKPPSSIVN
jgi:hypothetical protein